MNQTKCKILLDKKEISEFILDIKIKNFVECKYSKNEYCELAINFGTKNFCRYMHNYLKNNQLSK